MTLGGVADQENLGKQMSKCPHPLSWLNFYSKKDIAVRFLFRVISQGKCPIGRFGVKPIQGHEVENVDVSELVDGHLNFR